MNLCRVLNMLCFSTNSLGVGNNKPSSNIPRPEPGLMSTSSAENMVDGVIEGDRRERLLTTRPPEAEWVADLLAERDHE